MNSAHDPSRILRQKVPVPLLAGLMMVALTGRAALPPSGLGESDVQPLWAQVSRLVEAMDFIGHPVAPEIRTELESLRGLENGRAVIDRIESLLDPLCLGAVVLDGPENGMPIKFIPAAKQPRLLEQGWQAFPVKVINHTGSREVLRVDSPGARPLHGSPPEKVEERWIDIEAYDRRPMKPALSGLGLEYRIVQIWAREQGRHRARIAFSAGNRSLPGTDGHLQQKIWEFTDGLEGWSPWNECSARTEDGVMVINSEGGDPFLGAAVRMAPGEKILSFRARPHEDGMWQVFWMTESRPHPDEAHQNAIAVHGNGRDWGEYTLSLPVEGELTSIRLDPGHSKGRSEVDWIELRTADSEGSGWARAEIEFEVAAAVPVRFSVRDTQGKPATAAFVIRDREGRLYPPAYKRLAPDLFFQQQIYRADGESVALPPGEYLVQCSRGPESIPETQELSVTGTSATLHYRARKWVDPSERGWYSGDHHIHAAGCLHYQSPTEGVHPVDMMRQILGEDLKVGAVLTWGPCFDYQKQFFTGRPHPLSQFPFQLRYDVEVSGFGSHNSGHLCLLRLQQQIFPGGESKHHWPTLGMNTLRWAKAQGAITGPAHSAIGLGGNNGRVAPEDGPDGLPNYIIPDYNGIGANEYVVDVTHKVPGPDGEPVPAIDFISTMDTDRKTEWNMWYHTLNCGLRVRASGETDFPCITGERVGLGRVYVRCRGNFTYDEWCEGIREGRSYISDGSAHLMDFIARNGRQVTRLGDSGSEIRMTEPGSLQLRVTAASRRKEENGRTEVPVEVIVNGYPVRQQMIPADGTSVQLGFDIPIEISSWVALRIYPHAHTNPFFVVVDGAPVRPSRRSAQWMLAGVDQCWEQKKRFYHSSELEQAEKDYQHARDFYRKVAAEAVRD